MSTTYIFYNPISGNGQCRDEVLEMSKKYEDGKLCDMTKPETYSETLFSIKEDDTLIICGGDGTLNRFFNLTEDVPVKCEILYFPCGSGNDFAHDLGKERCADPFPITEYVRRLPTVTVKGKSHKFINAVGYGIDGYCCEVADKIRETSDKPINYAGIAIKGLLFNYKPTTATVTVDGVKHVFKKAWLAPAMNGRYYGGGMNAAPEQDRLHNETLSVMLFHGAGRLRTLMAFPSIFKGEHVKKTNMVTVLTGKEITVEFDSPRALQIDGETVLDVSGYTAKAPV